MPVAPDPIQPLWVMGSAVYLKRLSPLPAVAHFYRFHAAHGAVPTLAVPDAAVDVIIECSADRLNARVCGPVSRGGAPGFEEGHTYFGIRLRPEAIPHVGEASITELAGRALDLAALVPDTGILERIAAEPDFARQSALFEQCLAAGGGEEPDDRAHRVAAAVIVRVREADGVVRVGDLAADLCYSRRHLTRCFTQATGMDVKSFIDSVRFQNVLHDIRDGRVTRIADAVVDGGYYDQSHFQREFRACTSMTPRAFMRLFAETDYAHRITLV